MCSLLDQNSDGTLPLTGRDEQRYGSGAAKVPVGID